MAFLRRKFFKRETTRVAVDLLGQILVRNIHGVLLKGRIVETEAYLGLKDSSCHSYGGRRTPRTEVMYRSGGCIYVYFTYGKHFCFNIITRAAHQPEAVLIRALEPLKGIKLMQKNRGRCSLHQLTNGPGKLCEALAIDKSFYGKPLPDPELYVEKAPSPAQIISHPRVGLNPYDPAREWPLRFSIQGNPFVS